MTAEQLHWDIKITLLTAASTPCQQLSRAKPTGAPGMAAVLYPDLNNPYNYQEGIVSLSACTQYQIVRLTLFLCSFSVTNRIVYLVLMLDQLLLPKSHLHKSSVQWAPSAPQRGTWLCDKPRPSGRAELRGRCCHRGWRYTTTSLYLKQKCWFIDGSNLPWLFEKGFILWRR